ncbi:hypothetical protein KFE25_006587 [Diacronema lutheri]|uniref:Uncharacterized protein n=1 Tax=Diacronema lutheri TaxID=2081491 RepID=A0A8J5X9H2_DIALT|nr:hypothetical protein KFE25_006587 [Diacronema lutheri]
MPSALPAGWQKPSAAFAARGARASLPWENRPSTSPGPITVVASTINNGSQRAGLQKPTFARSKRFSEPAAHMPGPADYVPTPRSRALGQSASAAAIGYAARIELPWEAEAKEVGAFPGPGAYGGDVVDKTLARASSGVFKSASPRFKGQAARSPGAAAYNPRGHEVAYLGGSLALKASSAFASASARELQLLQGEVNPLGPGHYNGFETQSLSADINRSSRLKSPSFSSHSPRFRESKASGPGPADYTPKKKTEHSTTHAYSVNASF